MPYFKKINNTIRNVNCDNNYNEKSQYRFSYLDFVTVLSVLQTSVIRDARTSRTKTLCVLRCIKIVILMYTLDSTVNVVRLRCLSMFSVFLSKDLPKFRSYCA